MWDKRYDRPEYVYGKQANDFLQQQYQQLPKGKVLCIAEGEGRNGVFLAKQGYQVTAVDISSLGLAKAQKLAQENHVEITTICADLATFDLGEQQWDAIVSIWCHLPPAVRDNLYPRIEKALKPQGVLLLEGYRPAQLQYGTGGPSEASLMTSAAELQQHCANLDFLHLVEIEREVNEGINHTGLAAVVQAIARAS